MEPHTTRIWLFEDLEKSRAACRSGKDLGGRPPHWPDNYNLEVEEGLWKAWLPDDWGQGVLMQATPKPCFISPEGKIILLKTKVEEVLGKTLTDPYDDMPKEWPEWLPRDWGRTYKIEAATGMKKKLFVHPSFERSFGQKSDVEKFLAGNPNPKDPGAYRNFIVGPGALPDTHPQARTSLEPAMKKLKSSSTDSEVEGVGSDEESERFCGYRMRVVSGRSSWLVLPDDVESLTLDLLNDRIERAGWRCTQQGSRRYDLENTKDQVKMSLYAHRGRLLARTHDRSSALSVANTYMDLLYAE